MLPPSPLLTRADACAAAATRYDAACFMLLRRYADIAAPFRCLIDAGFALLLLTRARIHVAAAAAIFEAI